MNTPTSPRRAHPWKAVTAWVAGALACGACCAGPLLGLSGAIAALSATAAIWIPSLAGLAVAAALIGYLIHRRRRTATHRTWPAVTDLAPPPRRRPVDAKG